MENFKRQKSRLTLDRRETWVEYGKEEGENWLKNLANDDALRVAVNASDFDDAEDSLNRQDDYQFDYFKNNFRFAFQELLASESGKDVCDWDCEEYRLFKQGWITAVKKFGSEFEENDQ